MDFIYQYLSESIIEALGWTVLHSIWQGSLIGLLLAFFLSYFQKSNAQLRYWYAYIALCLVFITSLSTFFFYFESPIGQLLVEQPSMIETSTMHPLNVDIQKPLIEQLQIQLTTYFTKHLPLIVFVWLLGALLFMLRLIGSYIYVQKVKHRYLFPVAQKWQCKLQKLSTHIGLKQKVDFFESSLISTPMVIGFFKPILLFPVGAINQLHIEEVEAIIVHELAHIQRNDYVLNLIQSVIEVLFYYHPVIWWISNHIRIERENCCDDKVLEICNNPLDYAKALVSLQTMQNQIPILAMPLSNHKSHLLNRVKRILNQPKNKSNIMEKLTISSLLVCLLFIVSVSATKPYTNRELIKVKFEELKENNQLIIEDKNLVKEIDEKVLQEENNQLENISDLHMKKEPEVAIKENPSKDEESLNEIEILEQKIESRDDKKDLTVKEVIIENTSEQKVTLLEDRTIFPSEHLHHLDQNATLENIENPIYYLQLQDSLTKPIVIENLKGEISIKNREISDKVKSKIYDNSTIKMDSILDNYRRYVKIVEEIKVDGNEIEHLNKPSIDTVTTFSFKYEKLKPSNFKKSIRRLYNINANNQSIRRIYDFNANNQVIPHRLTKQGLIDPYDGYTITLSTKKMTINGKRQSKERHQEYLEFFEQMYGRELDADFKWNSDRPKHRRPLPKTIERI